MGKRFILYMFAQVEMVWKQTAEACSLKCMEKSRNDLLTAPSNRASWCSALITSELHLGCFLRYCSITLWFSIVLLTINAIFSCHSFAHISVKQNTSSLLTTDCIPNTCLNPFLGKFTRLFNEVQWQLHRILIWLQSKSLGESTGSKQMAEGIWWIIVWSQRTIHNLYLIPCNPLIFLMKD